MSALIVAIRAPDSSMPSGLTVLKPASVKLTVYVPGGGPTVEYWPRPLLTMVRVYTAFASNTRKARLAEASRAVWSRWCPLSAFAKAPADRRSLGGGCWADERIRSRIAR